MSMHYHVIQVMLMCRNIAIAEDNRLQVYDVSIIGPQLSLKADKSFGE